MGIPYQNTISGLLQKRSELMGEAQGFREKLASVSNDIEALDRVLATLGYEGDLKGMTPRGTRIVYFHRNELRRFCLDQLRQATGPITSREIAEKIVRLEGKDDRDRKLMNDMVKRVGKAMKLLRQQGVCTSQRDPLRNIVWTMCDLGGPSNRCTL